MEVKEAIYSRRSIRKFKDEEIDSKIIKEIITDATHAPSAHNLQPWKFKIVDRETKNLIANTLYNKYKDQKNNTASFSAQVIKNAPNLVVVFLDGEKNDINILSIGSIIDEILLLAEDKEIGTLWLADTNLIEKEIREITQIDLESISCLAFGYKNQFPHPRPRKEIKDVIVE